MMECLPSNYFATEVEVIVSLQNMLNKTSERLCDDIAIDLGIGYLQKLELVATLGFDSSSGHTYPNQKCKNPENESTSVQQSLFVSSIIIISLRISISNNTWINPTPQSVRFSRPLRITGKETQEASKNEFNRLNKEISDPRSYQFVMSDSRNVKVKYRIFQTLFDDKCINPIVVGLGLLHDEIKSFEHLLHIS